MRYLPKSSGGFTSSHALAGMLVALVTMAPSIAQTPVAHWTFDDGINNYGLTTIVDIANGNDAIWQDLDEEMGFDTSELAYAPGVIGGAVRLAGGSNQFFKVDSVPQINGITPTPDIGGGDPMLGVGVTWSAWIYVDQKNTSGNDGIFVSRTVEAIDSNGQSSGLNWAMNFEGVNHIDARITNGSFLDSPNGSILKGQWHHLAMVWGNVGNVDEFSLQVPSHRLYIDGVLQAETVDSKIYELVSSGSWEIGDDSNNSNREFEGLLDDFAIFDSALSTTDVQTLYNNGLNGINASGITTEDIVAGDVNGGGVSIDDFIIIRDNLGKTVAGRNLGDLNGDRKVDLDDFQQWLKAAPPQMAAAALANFSTSVPEPSSLLMLTLAAGAACMRRRLRRSPHDDH